MEYPDRKEKYDIVFEDDCTKDRVPHEREVISEKGNIETMKKKDTQLNPEKKRVLEGKLT